MSLFCLKILEYDLDWKKSTRENIEMYGVSENNTFAEIGQGERTVTVRSTQTGDVIKRLDEVDDLACSISFNNGSYMALGCHNGDILIYDTENGCSQIQRLARTYIDSDDASIDDSDDDNGEKYIC